MQKIDINFPLAFGWFYVSEGISLEEAYLEDINILTKCKLFGDHGYNFLTYPVGGLERYFWKPIK